MHNGPMMRAIDRERANRHSRVGLVRDGDAVHLHRALLVAVEIRRTLPRAADGLRPLVDVVHTTRRVHPSSLVIEALIDEELTPGQRSVGVESFLARDV